MRNMIRLFTLSAIMFSFVWNVSAEGEARMDRQTIAALLTKGDVSEIERIVVRLEQGWGRTHDPVYFEDMSAICQEMAVHVIQNQEWFSQLLRYSSLLLGKGEEVKDSDRCIMYVNQDAGISKLLDLLTDKTLSENPNWPHNRSQVFRLVAVFHRTIQSRYVPNFRPYEVLMNVMPPGGSVDAGADPASIKDPKAKAEYEAAIKENRRKGAINSEQRCLADIIQNELPIWESAFVEAYSQEPHNFEELNEYLQLGCFGQQASSRIISGLAKATGKDGPMGGDTL